MDEETRRKLDASLRESKTVSDIRTPPHPGLAGVGSPMLLGPREIILQDIHNREQRLIEKIALLRGLRQAVEFSTLDQAEKLLEYFQIDQKLSYLRD
jgi:hypothetical protein